jgi:hypothetical protein
MALHYVYGASNLLEELNRFLYLRSPNYTPILASSDLDIRVYHHATLQLSDPFTDGLVEKIRAIPVGAVAEGDTIGGSFDTVLLRDNWESDEYPRLIGIHGESKINPHTVFQCAASDSATFCLHLPIYPLFCIDSDWFLL